MGVCWVNNVLFGHLFLGESVLVSAFVWVCWRGVALSASSAEVNIDRGLLLCQETPLPYI